jgi:hypothetical protein
MKRILRRQKSGYVLSLILFLTGLTALIIVLWRTWQEVSQSQDSVSTFWTLIWTQQLNFVPGIEFKLAYLTILGASLMIVGVVVWVLSRQWFYLAGEMVLFRCPFCRKHWRARQDKGLVQCPHCHQLVHPTMVER